MTIPSGLTKWASVLTLLDPRLVATLAPLVRRIDDLVAQSDVAAASLGQPDGFGGISRHGTPERLLISQWALAEAEPLEFLRRAATAELLHLETHCVEPLGRGAVTVLADCGADQVGAARLVQLATLVVLHGRAERFGTAFRLGIVGDPPGNWQDGRIGDQLDRWLRSRRPDVVPASDAAALVAEWTERSSDADETWVLTGARTAAGLPGRRRLVVATESGWQASGVSVVDVRVDGRAARLDMPPPAVAVRALRGASLVHRPRTGSGSPDGHGPFAFTGSSTTLLARTADGAGVVRLRVSPPAPRPKASALDGKVITAAILGRRVVALVDRGERVVVAVVGKSLADLSTWSLPAEELPLDEAADTAGTVDPGFAPLVFDRGRLLTRLAGRWWAIDRDHAEVDDQVLGVCGTELPDQPLVARPVQNHIMVNGQAVSGTARRGAGSDSRLVCFGPGMLAWSDQPGRWTLPGGHDAITLDEGERVLGLHMIDGAPALVVLSPGEAIVRLRWSGQSRTLTAFSGGSAPSVHPVRPWLALRTEQGSLLVGDLSDGSTVLSRAAS